MAVKAARAGERGRGFAVVASEVCSLAGRSAGAAKEIKALMGASVDRIAAGSRLEQGADSAMEDIVRSVQRVSDLIGEITSATVEQSVGISQVNQAVGNLDQMTQQNAALVEESAAAAASLREQADQLAQMVSTFTLAQQATSDNSMATLNAGARRPVAASRPSIAAATAPRGKAAPSSPRAVVRSTPAALRAPTAPAPKVARGATAAADHKD